MKTLRCRRLTAFTLLELMIYCLLAGVVAMVTFQALRAGSSLSVKNASLNRSHESLRSSLDRLANNIRASRNLPTLLSAAGSPTTSSSAAGIRYDRILGEPYVLDPVSGAGSLPASTASISVWRSTAEIALPPVPSVGDVLLIDTPTGAARARVSGVVQDPPAGDRQKLTIAFAGGLGKPLSWVANQPQWARLVRQEAFIVVPVNGKNELRFYPSFETAAEVNNPAHYTVVTDQIGTEDGDETPFEIADVNGDKSLQANLRVEITDHNRWLTGKQSGDINTAFHLDLNLTSRLRPKNTN